MIPFMFCVVVGCLENKVPVLRVRFQRLTKAHVSFADISNGVHSDSQSMLYATLLHFQ